MPETTSRIMLRKANTEDITKLAEICRKCFTNSLRWNGLSLIAENWWRYTLATSAAETWVAVISGKAIGFSVLIFDELEWNRINIIQNNTIYKILNILFHPQLAFHLVCNKLSRNDKISANSTQFNKNPRVLPSQRSWLELIAVHPEYRKLNIGKMLLDHSTARTIDNKRYAIYLMVDTTNIAASRLYQKNGFDLLQTKSGKMVLVKNLK